MYQSEIGKLYTSGREKKKEEIIEKGGEVNWIENERGRESMQERERERE